MENVFLTSLTTPEVRQLFRKELEAYFESSLRSTKNPNNIESPITTKELCGFLGISEPTVIRWRKKGKIPFMQIGSAIRYNKEAVINAISNKVIGKVK